MKLWHGVLHAKAEETRPITDLKLQTEVIDLDRIVGIASVCGKSV